MKDFLANLPHLIMAAIVITAATVLAATHTISGGEAMLAIGSAGGFSLGAGASSASASGATQTVGATSSLIGPTAKTPTIVAVSDHGDAGAAV